MHSDDEWQNISFVLTRILQKVYLYLFVLSHLEKDIHQIGGSHDWLSACD